MHQFLFVSKICEGDIASKSKLFLLKLYGLKQDLAKSKIMPSPRQNWVVESKVCLIEVGQKNFKSYKIND